MSEPGHDPALQWLADASSSETTRRRSLEHSLLRQIRETATLAGSLAELAERARVVTVCTTWGSSLSGLITRLGENYIELTSESALSLLRINSLAFLPVATDDFLSDRDHHVSHDRSFTERVRTLAVERPSVCVTGHLGTVKVNGILEHVGADVMTITIDGPKRSSALVPIARVALVHLV